VEEEKEEMVDKRSRGGELGDLVLMVLSLSRNHLHYCIGITCTNDG
jgi:hypothetical protein